MSAVSGVYTQERLIWTGIAHASSPHPLPHTNSNPHRRTCVSSSSSTAGVSCLCCSRDTSHSPSTAEYCCTASDAA